MKILIRACSLAHVFYHTHNLMMTHWQSKPLWCYKTQTNYIREPFSLFFIAHWQRNFTSNFHYKRWNLNQKLSRSPFRVSSLTPYRWFITKAFIGDKTCTMPNENIMQVSKCWICVYCHNRLFWFGPVHFLVTNLKYSAVFFFFKFQRSSVQFVIGQEKLCLRRYWCNLRTSTWHELLHAN